MKLSKLGCAAFFDFVLFFTVADFLVVAFLAAATLAGVFFDAAFDDVFDAMFVSFARVCGGDLAAVTLDT